MAGTKVGTDLCSITYVVHISPRHPDCTEENSDAPVRLRRELDKVLKLQDQIDAVEKSIHEAKQSLTGGTAPADSLTHIRHLQSTHETLSSQAEALYASLNIHDSFPELRGLPLEFVRTLIIMRDLKMNIRDRAIESFYEWETLDRAVAGRREPLGILRSPVFRS